jgi:hypothetical protein
MAGDRGKAREILRELEERARNGFALAVLSRLRPHRFGETDQAMDLIERAVAERGGPAYGIKGSFLLAPLQTHPRFQALLKRMKLA